ncbi:hypothetical protein COU49_00385 [Candidatus Nomurabacteria bacterium CG10_big_fil_rev_8_21_14_0_10_35_16]|uniref:Acylphosphatase-like domain-containing protein n=1 Tax=Candidatus Nomurabacteria bacterium CG10_big_fil_rev_8_21_14_0_10_35_16 TaxID=1974731 RepID=A0A2H0TBX1_9BACT|nr:MAG: hypothetical protein COU49_00385 [Candidatus Nomurabacteria bacterium CG10_big_fil_rev_8_21_14_0_10_35_16]
MFSRVESVLSAKGLGLDYLFFVKDCAIDLSLVGIVCTRDDGSVKIIAEGQEDNLVKFVERTKQRNATHPIENFYLKWGKYTGEFKEFTTDCGHH